MFAANQVIKDYEILEDVVLSSTTNAVITDCKFQSMEIIDIVSSIHIENCTGINIKVINQGTREINFVNCNIKNIEIEDNSGHMADTGNGPAEVTIEGEQTIVEKITFLGDYRLITINNTNQITQIDFFFTKVGNIKIDSVKNTLLKFTNVIVPMSVNILSNEKTHLEFFETNINNIGILTPKHISLDFYSAKSNTITLTNGSYDFIHFRGTGEFDFQLTYPTIESKWSTVNTLKLSNFVLLDKSRIKLLDISFQDVSISDFENNGTFGINNCVINSNLKIDQSNLGKATFSNVITLNCDFSLVNSNITDTIFTNFIQKSDYKLNETEQFALPALRESYRQLKANFLKNGNKIVSLEFQKHELRMHYKILSIRKFAGLRDFGDFLIVATNKWSSDFGQNIWRPLLFLFLLHLVLFNLLLFFTPELGVRIGTSLDPELISKGTRLFFQTILPIHGVDIRYGDAPPISIAGFWDFVIRISSGYFIYYFISASRKYHQ